MFTPPSAAERPVTQEEAIQAGGVLWIRLPEELEEGNIRAAFRARVRDSHPYAGGDEAAWPARLEQLRAARDTLLCWLEQAPKADCRECGGTGYVWGKLAVKPCSRCG